MRRQGRRCFLGPGEGQEITHRGLLAGHHDAHAGIARAGGDGRAPQRPATGSKFGGGAGAFADADGVAAGDVAKLVGDDALQLVGVVGRDEQAGVDIDDLAAGDEGVDLGIVEQDDLDVVRVEAGGLDQRRGDIAEQQFGLAVAQDLLRGGRLGSGERQRERTSAGPDQAARGRRAR